MTMTHQDSPLLLPVNGENGQEVQPKDPTAYIPDEIWVHIFGNLKLSSDFLRSYQTCDTWRNILAPDRTMFMFPEVLPYLYPYLGKSGVLKCRQVCQDWERDIDNFVIKNHTEQFRVNFFKNGKHPDNDLAGNLSTFMTDMGGDEYDDQEGEQAASLVVSKNPFVARSAYIGFARETGEFLKQYGHELWTMALQVNLSLPSPVILARLLRDVFAKCPNLRKFRLHDKENYRMEQNSVSQELTRFLHVKKFPTLAHLKALDFYIKPSSQPSLQFTNQMAEHMISQNGEFLEELTINTFFPFETNSLPKLKSIKIRKDHPYLTDQLYSIQILESKVETIKVAYAMEQQVNSVADYPLLFQTFQHFSATLRQISISFRGPDLGILPVGVVVIGRDYQFPRVNLPRLTSLSITGLVATDSMKFDFLAELQSLESFTFNFQAYKKKQRRFAIVKKDDKRGGKMEVEIHRYLDGNGNDARGGTALYSSNIWKLLPKLKRVSMGTGKVYTREMQDYLRRIKKTAKTFENAILNMET